MTRFGRRKRHRGQVLFGLVAGVAAGDDIPFVALPAAGDGDDMVHRQFRRREFFAAIVANACGQLVLPPLRGPQFPCPCPFARDMLRRGGHVDPVTTGFSFFAVFHSPCMFPVIAIISPCLRKSKVDENFAKGSVPQELALMRTYCRSPSPSFISASVSRRQGRAFIRRTALVSFVAAAQKSSYSRPSG